MGVNVIPNQVVKLFDTENFNQRNKRLTWDGRTYCQLVRETQTSMFQLQVTPSTGTEILTNSQFDSGLTGWSYPNDATLGMWQVSGTSSVQGQIGFAGFTDIQQPVSLTAGRMYVFKASIGQIVTQTNLSVRLMAVGGEVHDKRFYVSEIGKYDSIVTMYFYSAGYTAFDIKLVITGKTGDLIYLDALSLLELTEPVVTIEDCEGVTKRTLTPFTRASDRINYAIEWFGLTEGCYRVCIDGVDDLDFNYLERGLALTTEGGSPILLEDGGILKWYG